jgi:hypothetical protein
MTPEVCARTIAYNIRAELVCCDAYERFRHHPDDAENAGHGLCYWGEAAARVALSTAPTGFEPSAGHGGALRDWGQLDTKR